MNFGPDDTILVRDLIRIYPDGATDKQEAENYALWVEGRPERWRCLVTSEDLGYRVEGVKSTTGEAVALADFLLGYQLKLKPEDLLRILPAEAQLLPGQSRIL
ncbi:hypothetical protein A3J78_00510 [Candidatus Beckwithbacteria bacterium RBG_13_35_6]|uniref:Uncharacterized protein n=1 Tax=Candidatus Beckwithbacteria bacterium RBG_13_35_6 TaxID=1797456 RepID=A0A1F5DCJ3_9BACT|nr:MAG: hypothetical protein A3J78_00510 [Candidatus Beckwithbacteria bacterium RBG_13_35_6]